VQHVPRGSRHPPTVPLKGTESPFPPGTCCMSLPSACPVLLLSCPPTFLSSYFPVLLLSSYGGQESRRTGHAEGKERMSFPLQFRRPFPRSFPQRGKNAAHPWGAAPRGIAAFFPLWGKLRGKKGTGGPGCCVVL